MKMIQIEELREKSAIKSEKASYSLSRDMTAVSH